MNMDNEEFDRKTAFIVEQQAHFASDIQRLQESQAQFQESQARTDHVVAQTAEAVGQMGEVVTRLAKVTHAGFAETSLLWLIAVLARAKIASSSSIKRAIQQALGADSPVSSFYPL